MISVIIPSLPGSEKLNQEAIDSYNETAQTPFEIVLQVKDAPFAVNVNAGLRKAKGNIILVSNNDVTALPGWDTWLLHAPKGIVSMSPRPDCGWAWAAHKDIIKQVGELDEKLVNSYEDYDYYIRAALKGYNRVLASRPFLVHEGGCTLNQIWGKFEEQSQKRLVQCRHNRDYMLHKWPGIDIDSVPFLDWALHGTEIVQAWREACNR